MVRKMLIAGYTGTFAGGFLIFGLTALVTATCLAIVSQEWEHQFIRHGGIAPGSTDYDVPVVDEVLSPQGVVS